MRMLAFAMYISDIFDQALISIATLTKRISP